jgi:hypothetical protein
MDLLMHCNFLTDTSICSLYSEAIQLENDHGEIDKI